MLSFFFFFFVALDKLIVLIAYSLNKSSRICLWGGCYDCYDCYVLTKLSRSAPLSAPLEPFSKK